MKTIKSLFFLMLVILACEITVAEDSKEDCSHEGIGFEEGESPAAVYFYTGTCHYRNNDFEFAAQSWKKLAALDEVEEKYSELQIHVLNNLGFLKFYGLGIKENKTEAIRYWQKAVSLGHEESEYHLCHAFADKGVITYAPKKAVPHCEKALKIYQDRKERDEDEEVIYMQLKKYVKSLK